MKGDENLVRLLLGHNADVNIQNNHQVTPLCWSVEKGSENFISLLLEHNADLNIQNKDGYTPLHRLVLRNDENLVRLSLEHNVNADVNIQDNNGYTALHLAVMNGTVNIIRLLLEHKADVNIQHKYGFTPLHLSARFIHKDGNEIIDLLLQYGVRNIDIRDVEGRTPVQMAVRCGNAQAVKKLVDLGADVSLVKADKKDAVELERLYYEAESVEWNKKRKHWEVAIGVESDLKSERKTNEQNSRRRTRSIGRSEKNTCSEPPWTKGLILQSGVEHSKD